jgi:hypothetical protein
MCEYEPFKDSSAGGNNPRYRELSSALWLDRWRLACDAMAVRKSGNNSTGMRRGTAATSNDSLLRTDKSRGGGDKAPRLLWDKDFSASHFGIEFDWIIDFATRCMCRRTSFLTRLPNLLDLWHPVDDFCRRMCLRSISPLTDWNSREECPLLHGHDGEFKSNIHWREFRRAPSDAANRHEL